MSTKAKRKIIKTLVVLLLLVGAGAVFGWYKFFREQDQPPFADEAERFKYGSIGAEFSRGIPYWIWVVLPRLFPELMPGPGGYKSFGLVWEEGKEIPVGFSKKVIGFPRIANNCAICHVGTWRGKQDEVPHVVVAAPAHTVDVQGMIRFLAKAGGDSRFNAGTLLTEIDRETKLSFIDRQLYRFVLIPFTKRALQQQEKQFAWMNRAGWPDWGPGRDDPMNLTKYFMTGLPVDNTVGSADFPSIWNLGVRDGDGLFLNWDGATPSPRSVIIDSALGLGAPPGQPFLKQMDELEAWLKTLPPPKYPYEKEHAIDAKLAATGRPLYDKHCASCHEPGKERTNKVIPIDEIKTDRERLDTWTQAGADEANGRVKEMGITRKEMIKTNGYVSPPLDGVWL